MTSRSIFIAPPLFMGVIFLAVADSSARAENWPQFRGELGRGVGAGNPPTAWSVQNGENIRWRTPIPGLAHASPIVWDDQVIVLTAVASESDAVELTTGWEGGAGQSANDKGPWIWRLISLSKSTGKQSWSRDIHTGLPAFGRHPKSTHANCTPATNGERIVVMLGAEGLHCFDMSGAQLWSKGLGELNASPKGNPDLQWGFASSPVIAADKVVIQADCDNTNFWAAYDLKSGEELIRVPRDERSAWSTPAVFAIGGRQQVVLNGYQHMGAYDLETGESIWKMHGGGDVPVPTPIRAAGMIYLTNAHGARRPVFAVNESATGDLGGGTDTSPAGLAWVVENMGSYMPTPIVVDNILYVCNDTGILTAFDSSTGKRHYRKRMPAGGNYTASAVAAGGNIYFTNEEGEVNIIKAGEKFREVGVSQLGAVTMATPAISGDVIFFRTQNEIVAIGG